MGGKEGEGEEEKEEEASRTSVKVCCRAAGTERALSRWDEE